MKKVMITIVVFIFCIGIQTSYAKYESQIKGKIVGAIAEPIMKVTAEESIIVTGISPKQKYIFSILNYEESNKINEAQMKYSIEFMYKQENITLELYKGEEKIEIKNKKTPFFPLKIKEKQEDDYMLKIEYNYPEKREEKDIMQEIQIKVHSIQER